MALMMLYIIIVKNNHGKLVKQFQCQSAIETEDDRPLSLGDAEGGSGGGRKAYGGGSIGYKKQQLQHFHNLFSL